MKEPMGVDNVVANTQPSTQLRTGLKRLINFLMVGSLSYILNDGISDPTNITTPAE